MSSLRVMLSISTFVFVLAACAQIAFAEYDDPEWRALENRIDRLLAQLEKSGETATGALDQLVQIGEPAVYKLIAATGHQNPNKRMYAVTALGRIGDKRALDRIHFMVQHDQYPLARIAAVRALFAFGDNSAGKFITTYVDHDTIEVRRYAIITLGVIGFVEAVPLLRARITKNKDNPEANAYLERHPGALCDIATSLNRLGDDSGLPIIAMLSREKEPAIRVLAVQALTHFKGELAVIYLAAALTDPNTSISDIAYNNLFKRRAEVIPIVQKAYLSKDTPEELKQLLAKALKELGGAVPKTAEEIAAEAASKIEQGKAPEDIKEVDRLMVGFRNTDEKARKAASDELLKLGARAIPRLIELFSEESSESKLRIIGIMALIKDKRCVPFLIGLLEYNVLPVRCRAAWALGEIPDNMSIPALINALTDSQDNMRFYTINSLQKLTGMTNGFQPRGTEEERKAAITTWKNWWDANKNTFKPQE